MLKKKTQQCLLLLTFVVFALTANATTYYISSSGNDSNSGTDASSPWQSLKKLNSARLSPGDKVLFRRGDTFYGSIVVSNSGSSGNPITYGAYGSGSKPIITGFTNITSWNNIGGNIWESSDAVSSLPYTNMVAVNGVNTAMGRYPNSTGPNTGYLYIKSHSGSYSITATGGLGSNNWTGAGIVIRKQRWALERGTITSQSGNTLNYKDANIDNPQDGWGFFVQNDPKTLDVNGEWYYNPSSHKLRIYSSSRPTDVKIATVENLVSINRQSFILFDNIAFTGSNSDALYCANYGSDLTVQNCDVSFAGLSGIWSIMKNSLIQYNNISNANYLGIYTTETNATIQYNTLNNINLWEGMDQELTSAGAIVTVATSTIQYNQVSNCGYSGIKFSGPNTRVKNNFVNGFCMIKEDGGGIDMSARDRAKGSVIDGNIVINGIGASRGTSDTTSNDFGGIFIDAYGSGITITNNSVANVITAGIKLHGTNNIIVKNNTTYNNGGASWTKGGLMFLSASEYPISNITVEGNIFVARTSNQVAFFGYPVGGDVKGILSMETASNNYYAKPTDPTTAILISRSNFTVSAWQAYSGFDANSYPAPKTISNVNDLRFEYNASSSAKTISLDANYIDVKNNNYDGSITLQPYTSAVLIKSGSKSTNKPPVASVGSDRVVQLPQNSVVLPGNGTDPDGTVVGYVWSQLSGPSTATISNSSSAQAGAGNLVAGVYQFQLQVTDNQGATGTAVLKVTVVAQNAIANVPPVVNVGSDRVIDLPKNSIVLPGSATDSDGSIVSYSWSQMSGPSTATLVNPNSAQGGAGDLIPGVYVFQLKATDDQGAFATSLLKVTVNSGPSAAPNIPPVASVGSDRLIELPKNSIVLPGSGRDSDGVVVGYSWTQVSGPSTATLVNPNSAQAGAGDLITGAYQFKLVVTDNQGATGSATLNVTVAHNPVTPLLANVGSDRVIQLPQNSIVLPGSGTDADGTIKSYLWTQKSGPSQAMITSPNTAYSGASGLTAGVYVFQLTVTNDRGDTNTADLRVTVQSGGSVSQRNMGGSATDSTANSPIMAMNSLSTQLQPATLSVGVTAYPNPFTNSFVVSITGDAGPYEMSFIDASGRTLWTKKGTKSSGTYQETINTSDVVRGIYFLNVIQNNKTSTVKLEK
jgi:hypothetical protein